MVPEPGNLITERFGNKVHIPLRLDAAELVVRHKAIDLPLPETAPPDKGQQPHAVTKIIYILRSAPDIFETYGVQVHILYVAEFDLVAAVRVAQKDVIRPARTFDKDFLAVEFESPVAFLSHIGVNLADTEVNRLGIGLLSSYHKRNTQAVHLRSTHIMAPPESWIVNHQHSNHFRVQCHLPGTIRIQTNSLSVSFSFKFYLKLSLDGFVAFVGQCRFHSKPGLVESGCIHLGAHGSLGDRNRLAEPQPHRAEDAHTFVGRPWIPVDKTYIEIPWTSSVNFYFQFILLPKERGNIETELSERALDLIAGS